VRTTTKVSAVVESVLLSPVGMTMGSVLVLLSPVAAATVV